MQYTLPDGVKQVLKKFKNSDFEAYVVGGCVRDLILGKKTKDWDFTTSANPEQILHLFPDGFYDNAFGTVGVAQKKIIDGQEVTIEVFEITTYRTESEYTDHRHPKSIVWGTSLHEDLARRDFTINSIAYDGTSIIDPYHGIDDIAAKLIRAVGDPNKRFGEDALRMMRAIRLATQLGFTIEDNTFSAIKTNAQLITKISQERIRDELLKILASEYPSEGIYLLKNSGILAYILPEVEKSFGVQQKSPKRHHIFDVGTHLVMSLKHCPTKDPIVRLATLLHDIGKPLTVKVTPEGVITFYNHEIIGASIARNIAFRLHLSKTQREKVVKLVRWHQFTVDERQTDGALRRFVRNVGKEDLVDMLALRIGDRLGGGARETSWRLELFKKRLIEVQKKPFTVADLVVDGNDVMEIYKVRPGPFIGIVLNTLFKDVVEEKIKNDREELLKRLKDLKETGTLLPQ